MDRQYDTLILFGDSGSRISEIVRYTTLKKVITLDELNELKSRNESCIMPSSIKGVMSLQENETIFHSSIFVTIRYDEDTAVRNLARLNEIEHDEAKQIIEEERNLIDCLSKIDIIVYADKEISPVEISSQILNKVLKHANINDPRKYDFQEYKCLRSIWKKQNILLPEE